MRFQGWAGLVAGPAVAAIFGYRAESYPGLWVFLGVLAAGVSGAVLAAARAVDRRGRARPGVVAEFGVLLVGAWAVPLLPLTVLVPLYVLFLLGGAQPQ